MNTVINHLEDSSDFANSKIYVKGKFLYCGSKKFYVKGVTYGTFKPEDNDFQFPVESVVEKDFALMVQSGLNCIRTYSVPPNYLFDVAQKYGLKVMVGLPWEQHITFLDDPNRKKDIVQRMQKNILSFNRHPAIFCYVVGNEIPAPIVRWHGKKKIERFIRQLYLAVKEIDPDCLVTYVNYPTTEYLDLSFLDFSSFNVYFESPDKLSAYLFRLHNLAGNRPLVLAETGLDSLRNGEQQQAETLQWQIETIFARGCAGMFVFAWTDEWWRGGWAIEDWNFGIVDRQRNPKPALNSVSTAIKNVPINPRKELPFISVVICSYNGSATIRDTMEGVQKLDYPNYEVIVVNDGSIDHTAAIVQEYPVKLISTSNRGLGAARNTGWQAARGEIIAYIDDDAYPDSHWLLYLGDAFLNSTHAGIGGPNIVPENDGPIAHCVANAPGSPLHVLVSDELAEHIPGCNMSFRRYVLEEIGGFDPFFRVAGDDVDLCWRIQNAGYTLGFHPSSVVWHHRRNSIKTYWKQQKGYGKAEALLEEKWPAKYNGFGHLVWTGRLYGHGFTLPVPLRKEKILYGTWGSALFQSIYQPANGLLMSVLLMPEIYLALLASALIASLGIWWQPLRWVWLLFGTCLLAFIIQAVISSFKNASLSFARNEKLKYRLVIISLHLLQPLARLWGRLKNGLSPWRNREITKWWNLRSTFDFHTLTYWSENWHTSEQWLTNIEKALISQKIRVSRGGEFDRWDLRAATGLFASSRAMLAIEEHGSGKQFLKLKTWSFPPLPGLITVGCFLLAAVWAETDKAFIPALVLLGIALILIIEYLKSQSSVVYCFKKVFNNLNAEGKISVVEKLAEGTEVSKAKEQTEIPVLPFVTPETLALQTAATSNEIKKLAPTMRQYTTLHLVRRILSQARPYWLYITGILLTGLLSTPIALVKPLAIKLLIDSAFGSHPVPDFIRILFPKHFVFSFNSIVLISATLVIIVTLVENLYNFVSGLLETYTGEKLVLNFRTLLFNHIQRISLAYHDKKGTADSLYRLQWDAAAIRSLLLSSLPSLVSSLITLVSMIIVMFSIHRYFALITFCIIPPLFILTRFSRKRIKRGWKKIKKDESFALAVLHEVMGSLRVVKAFGQEDKEEKRFVDQADKALKGQLEMARFGSLYNFMVGLLFAFGTALFIYLGARYVQTGQMTLGELTLVLAYLGQVFGPLQSIAKNINNLQSSILSTERVFELLDQEKEVTENPNPHPLPKEVKGGFEFQNVGFSYEDNKPAIQNVSFQIQAGERVGIMGSTGAGKTTLISLLIRFYDPSYGRISLDGTDIKSFRLSDYRSQFSIVLQEPVLFSTTIAENIRYGRPGASDIEIIAAAKAANAHDFIMSNPAGYDALVGERGMQLSGGERQRISLARAFIINAPVLILDEPTSSVDIKTEALILEAMERLMKGRTTFMITHRLDTLASCDLILHLEEGKIVDLFRENNPDALLRKKAAILNRI